jgi:hypothetical protein
MAARKKKPRLPASVTPHSCVILSVDTAQRSGWCVYVDGKYASSGEIDMLDPSLSTDQCGLSGWSTDRVCLHALWECAEYEGRPAVLVFERPFRGTTQGQWIGAWKQAWALNSGHKRRVCGVYPSSWRARVLGPGWARAGREQVRKMELAVAARIAGRDVKPDEAAAICIGDWATKAGEVLALLPKRRRAA